METSGLGNEGRKKPSLVEYKQVILELNQALNSLSQQNKQLQECKGSLQGQLEKCVRKLNCLEEKLKLSQKQCKEKSQENQFLKNQIKQLQVQIKRISTENQFLSKVKIQQSQRTLELTRLNDLNVEKIKMMEQDIESLVRQLNFVKMELQKERSSNLYKIKDLQEFNNNLKRKYQVLQMESFAVRPSNYGTTYEMPNFENQGKRCFSTQKKRNQRNNGCLSTNPNLGKQRRKSFIYNQVATQSIRPFGANPQFCEGLQQLKKDIAHQYTLLSLKSQNYNRQRVSKTLQELKKRMMGKASDLFHGGYNGNQKDQEIQGSFREDF